ncbi:MAG: hypothetical protein MRY51_08165 [Flavobacteriaceae bacterium]|nr:hypothetical protein [Flavobacteriaceae bacterium]MCI5087879.1 hypothetical protein [Flavobacteriaceae bacterium]
MDYFGPISFFQNQFGKLFPEIILVVQIDEEKSGNYILNIKNEGKKDIKILGIYSNGVDVNQLSDWEKFPIPFSLIKKNSITRKFFLTKTNHYNKPEEIQIEYKTWFGRKSKTIVV